MPGCSTTHQLLRLTEYISSGFEMKQSTVATFLDISKAYDTTWHTGLVYKLIKMEVPGDLVKIIKSFLAQRSFRVKMDGAYSEWRPMLAGVPQGSVLSPMLYNLYTSDLPRFSGTQVAMYADDICIYVKDKCAPFARAAVQRHLNIIDEWAKQWRITINANKTAAVIFSKKNKIKLSPLTLNNADIDYVESHRYLGVDLQRRLNWTTHCTRIRGKAKGALRSLGPLIRSRLPLSTKLLLFKTYIRPVMTYAAPAWAFIPKSSKKYLQAVQNKFLRIIGGYDYDTSTEQMCSDNDITTLDRHIKILTTRFYAAAKNSRNTHIRALGTTPLPRSRQRPNPLDILR